jgi:hypothetical protein
MQPRFPDRLRLPLEFEPARLAADMAAVAASGWIAHFVKQNYDGDWSAIPLRGPTSRTRPCLRQRPISAPCSAPSNARCRRCG